MRERDQKARNDCSGSAEEQMKCYGKVAETVDKPNTKRINEIYNAGGFPTVKRVGRESVEAFYLLLQHSNDLALKQKCLPGIKRAFRQKVISANDYTNFTDRLLVNLGKPQIYGGNFEMKDGKLVMSPTLDLKNLDKRRKSIGLPPIAEYVKMLKKAYKLDVVISSEN